MSLPPNEAAHALQDIGRAEHRSALAYHYQIASPHLFLWGAVWFLGYGVSYFFPQRAVIWLPLMVVGIAASIWLTSRTGAGRPATSDRPRGIIGRYAVTIVALSLFFSAFFAILPPKSVLQIDAVLPLLIGLWYVLLGVWTRGSRMALLGLVLGLLTVGGYFWLQQYFLLWMAVVGGGALILGGFWLRRV